MCINYFVINNIMKNNIKYNNIKNKEILEKMSKNWTDYGIMAVKIIIPISNLIIDINVNIYICIIIYYNIILTILIDNIRYFY